jgi:TRAP-type C4-dicarboxylate transport system permease small subunit
LREIVVIFIFLEYFIYVGWIWTKNQMTADSWLLDVKIRVTGRGRVGADGMVKHYFFLIRNSIVETLKRNLENLFFQSKKN